MSFIGALAALALVGCGGGGGGKSKGSSGGGMLALSLVGTAGNASGPVGTFQHIVVYRNGSEVVDEKTVDVSSGTTQVNLTNLPAGTLHLHLGLLPSAGASEIGAVDTTIQGGVALAPMQVVMAQPVTSTVVTPTTVSVNVNATLPLYAAAKAADGSYVYTASNGWRWTSDSAAAAVSPAGVVSGLTQGAADITLTHVASGTSAVSTVGVLPNGVAQGKWTVMVFLNAANSLYPYAPLNVNQMEKVANNPNVRFVIQWKQSSQVGEASGQNWSGTRRYLATYDTGSSVKSTMVQDLGDNVDMGSGAALSDFVDWTKAHYPADHYAMVVWDHGSGWYYNARRAGAHARGVSLDETTGHLLSPEDIRTAFLGRHVDVLAYDACLMQSAEMLFETASCADYLVGSEDDTPADGYPYDTIFKPFAANPDVSVPDLAKNFATGFQSSYGSLSTWAIQQSVVQTSKLPALRTALDNLGTTLVDNDATLGTLMSDVRGACGATDSTGGGADFTWLYYDLDQVCQQTASRTTNASVASAANAVRSALADMTVSNTNNSKGAFLRGLSIEFSNSGVFNATRASSYANLQIAGQTHWDEFLSSTTANP